MRRRDFIKGVVGPAIAWSIPALAQSPVAVVGFLNSASPDGFGERITAFKHGLQQTGYIADRNVKIEYRWAEGHFDRLPLMADELVKRRADVIAATGSSNSALAARAATATIPIVFTTGGDPVADGLVTNLSRPGGNVTGMTNFSNAVLPKRLGLIRELLPSAALIAVLVNPSNTSTTSDIKTCKRRSVPADKTSSSRMPVLNVRSIPLLRALFKKASVPLCWMRTDFSEVALSTRLTCRAILAAHNLFRSRIRVCRWPYELRT